MSNETKSISFYNEFKCIGKDCPNTCCKGWLVPVDDESVKRYHSMKNMDGLRLSLNIKKYDDMHVLNKNLHGCPMFTNSGLCKLQVKYGEEYLCKVCRLYPRVFLNLTPASFRFLDLSCPAVSSLFIKSIDNMSLISDITDKSSTPHIHIDTTPYGTNEDKSFFAFLMNIHSALTDIINTPSYSLHELYTIILNLASSAQKAFTDINRPDEEKYALVNECLAPSNLQNLDGFHIGARTIDRIMTGGYFHTRIKKESKLLYSLCQLYFKSFDGMSLADLDSLFSRIHKVIPSNTPFTIEYFLRKHLWYEISLVIPEIYEDYSFLRKLTIPIIKNQLLNMFLWLYGTHVEPISTDNLPKIISAFHRRGGGTDGIYAEFFNFVYEYELKDESI